MTAFDGVFVTGTDTGVGKTWSSLALMAVLKNTGLKVLGMKPVASGCLRDSRGLTNEDAVLLQENGSFRVPYSQINPYAFAPAIAPHIAAELAGVTIKFEKIISALEELQSRSDFVVVEGVGGWEVPIGGNQTVRDLALALRLPVILVVGLRLGCLNHAILTYKSIKQSGALCSGWIASEIDPEFEYREQNIQTLKRNLIIPFLGCLPNLSELAPESLGQALNVDEVFGL